MTYPATPGGAVASGPSRTTFSREPRTRPALTRRFLTSLLAVTSLLACSADSSVTSITNDTSDPPSNEAAPSLADAQLSMVSGDQQTGEVASYLADPLIVKVVDANGDPFADAPVEWVFYQGAGKLGDGQSSQRISTTTDDDGISSVRWQMGTKAGAQSAAAEIVVPSPVSGLDGAGLAPGNGNGKKVGFDANAKPGDIESISVTPASPTLALADSVDLAAMAVDHYGNRVEGLSYQWRSSNESVAFVGDEGWTHGMSSGTATVSAKYKSVEGSASVAVVTDSEPVPPTASIVEPYGSTTIVLGDTVRFLGDASDPDGTIQAHRWDFGDGNTAAVEDPGAHVFATTGSHAVTYRVTDDQGLSATASTTVTVEQELNAPPVASITSPAGDVTIDVGDAVDFRGAASDEDGTVASHAWSFGDGGTATVEDPGAHTYDAQGTYTVTYRVTDDLGATSSTQSLTVTVAAAANQSPTASIVSPSSNVTITIGDAVDFQGSASDSDGSVVTHAWSFGDGGTATVEDPGAYTYGSVGTYEVRYEVTDDGGATGVATRSVSVVDPDTPPPASGELLIASDWSNGDWSDGGKWGNASASVLNGRAQVVSAGGGEPWANKLQVTASNSTDSWSQMVLDAGADVAVGQCVTVRWYQRVLLPDAWNGDALTHGIALGNTNGGQPWINHWTRTDGTYRFEVQVGNDFDPMYSLPDGSLDKGTWYRIEWTNCQETSSRLTVAIHVYDLAGNQVFGPGDFTNWPWADGQTDLTEASWNLDRRSAMDSFVGWNSGLSGLDREVVWAEYAAVAIVAGDHAGSYDPARGW